VIEILVYETSEAAIVHYFIPNLVQKEIQTVVCTLRKVVQEICSPTNLKIKRTSAATITAPLLNTPRYLFVSTQLAQRFPSLMESIIILSYQSDLPSASYRHKLHSSSPASQSIFLTPSTPSPSSRSSLVPNFFHIFSLSLLLTSTLQYLGSQSPFLQRLVIHSLQPVVVASLFLFFHFILHSPLYLLILIPVLCSQGIFLWKYFHVNSQESLSLVHIDQRITSEEDEKKGSDESPEEEGDGGRADYFSISDESESGSESERSSSSHSDGSEYAPDGLIVWEDDDDEEEEEYSQFFGQMRKYSMSESSDPRDPFHPHEPHSILDDSTDESIFDILRRTSRTFSF
jgi:hypothetical protein